MRSETGIIQFGEDWPCIFIRGDNALYYSYQIRLLLNSLNEDQRRDYAFIILQIEEFIKLLNSCNTNNTNNTEVIQALKSFEECQLSS